MAAPPLNVAAPIVTFAVVAEAALALTDAGAPGTVGRTPMVTVVLPVATAPPETVVEAVMVNVVALSATVGVPEIVPVAVSKESPAGSVPLMEYVVPVGDDAEIDVVTGVI